MYFNIFKYYLFYFNLLIITHFKLFYVPDVIGLVQQLVWFVMHTEPKAPYWTVQ